MKSSLIKGFGVMILTLGAAQIAVAQSSYSTANGKKADHPTTAEKQDVIQQRFNPIYGTEKEANDLLGFIAANMILELDPMALKNVDGYAVVNFFLDTLGNIDRIAVVKSIRPWIDYAIIGGMKRMPAYGKPSVRNNGKVYESRHDVVFSFGSYVRPGSHTYGFQGEAVAANTQAEIDRQRNEHFDKLNNEAKLWNKFTSKNAILEYDTKSGLKNQAGILLPDDQLGMPNNTPPHTPTITITNKEVKSSQTQ